MSSPPPHDAEVMLQELRQLLLNPDRQSQRQLEEGLRRLEHLVEDEEELAGLLAPLFEEHTAYLKDHFPQLFSKSLGAAIKLQIRESQGEIIDALYPIMGKLIRKYLRAEIARISQQIDDRLQDPFSLETLKLRLQAFFTGTSYQELLLRKTALPVLEDLFIIDKENGLSLAHHSLHKLTQPDVVAGMLTGIKSFVEHAFDQGAQELEQLAYEEFKVYIFSFETFYVAAGVSGQPDAAFIDNLYQKILAFLEEHPVRVKAQVTREDQDSLSESLQTYFDGSHSDH